MRILLVDDSKTILHANERVLQQSGYEVVCAEDGEAALRMKQRAGDFDGVERRRELP